MTKIIEIYNITVFNIVVRFILVSMYLTKDCFKALSKKQISSSEDYNFYSLKLQLYYNYIILKLVSII